MLGGRSAVAASTLRASLLRPQSLRLGRELLPRSRLGLAFRLSDENVACTIHGLQMERSACHSHRRFCAATTPPSTSADLKCDEVLTRFRRRAAADLLPYTEEKAASSRSAAELRLLWDDVAKDELGSKTECAAQVEEELNAAVTDLATLEELRAERPKLRHLRADLLQVSFQSQTSENQEFGALVICATAGIFAVSLHYGFFSIFIVSYWLYRRATKEMRKQYDSVEELADVLARLKEIDVLEADILNVIRGRATSWQDGHPAPALPEVPAAPEVSAPQEKQQQ